MRLGFWQSLLLSLVLSVLASCSCNNGEGYCGGPKSTATADPTGGGSPFTPGPSGVLTAYYWLEPGFTCLTFDGKTIPSYKDVIEKRGDRFFSRGTSCTATDIEIPAVDIVRSDDPSRGLLGYNERIYDGRSTAPTFNAGAYERFTETWCREFEGSKVRELFVTRYLSDPTYFAFLYDVIFTQFSVTRQNLASTRRYEGTGLLLDVENAFASGFPFEHAGTYSIDGGTTKTVRCRTAL